MIYIAGPKLPFKLKDSVMITSPSDRGVILIGGYNDSEVKTSKLLLELSGYCMESLHWTVLEQKLKFLRSYHVAFPLPNKLIE